MESDRIMAEQVDKHRWVVEAHMDTEGNLTGYWIESDAGDCQYLTAEEYAALQRRLKERTDAD
jgi:hypothetical protein